MEIHETPHWSSVEAEERIVYRSLSRLAIASLVFGVLSFLAIFTAAAWVLSVLAVGLGVAGVRAIAREEAALTGRRAALWGISLGILFGAWGLTSFYTDQWLTWRQSRELASHFLELVREGEIHQAHQIHVSHLERVPPGTPWGDHYDLSDAANAVELGALMDKEERSPTEELRVMFEQRPLSTIVDWAKNARIHYDGRVFLQQTGDRWGHRYTLVHEESGEKLEITVLTARTFDEESQTYYWNVDAVIPRREETFY